MRIAICDDSIKDIDELHHSILAHDNKHEIHKFTSPTPFLERILTGEKFDLLFLDVQMPNSDGWTIAKELKQAKCNVFIAMVTVLNEYIYDCFDRVDWFAPKPITQEKVFKILDNAQTKLYPKVFEFDTERVKLSLTAPEIIYIEVQHNNLFIHTLTNSINIRMPLKTAMAMLTDCRQFVQVHSSYIINLAYLKEVEGTDIMLKNGIRLRLTRTYRNLFFKALYEYIKGV